MATRTVKLRLHVPRNDFTAHRKALWTTHLSLLLLTGESVTTYVHAIAGEQKAMVERMDENYLRAAKSS